MQDELTIPSGMPEDFIPTQPEGLSEEEAARRRNAGFGNASRADDGKSGWTILAENLFTFFNLLNLALALCLVAVGSYRNMLFLGVVVSNTLIGTVQELRAQRTLRKLQVLNAPAAHVMRNGREITLHSDDLVKGDVAILRAGDQVLADAIVLDGNGAVDEALLTGESDAVPKQAGDWLMSGSYISEGRFTAQLVCVGDESYANRLTRAARKNRHPASVLMTDLNKLLRGISIILTPLGLMMLAKQALLLHFPMERAVPSAVAAMLGMIPEGLVLLTSVAMAVGVVRLGRRGALVQELYGIENLARADVVCLDKTGTLTTGDMVLERMVPLETDENEMRHALSRFLGCFDVVSGTLSALAAAAMPGSEKPVAVLPFSSRRKNPPPPLRTVSPL